MNVFIVSTRGDCYKLAKKLMAEGHKVKVYIRNRIIRKKLVDDMDLAVYPSADMISAALIIVEDNGSGRFSDQARKLNRPILCGGTMSDKIFNDGDFALDIIKGCGLKFADVGTNGILTEVGSWFTGEEFLRPHFIGLKDYRIGTGDVGPWTNGMGITGCYKMKSRLFNEVLKSTEIFFKSLNYIGYVGIEGYINNASFRVTKISPGLTFPTLNLLTDLHTTIGNFLLKLALKKAEVTAVQPDRIGVGIVWLSPSYFIDPQNDLPMMFTGIGETLQEAKSKAYKSLHKAQLPAEGYFRIDIGTMYDENMKLLSDWKWV